MMRLHGIMGLLFDDTMKLSFGLRYRGCQHLTITELLKRRCPHLRLTMALTCTKAAEFPGSLFAKNYLTENGTQSQLLCSHVNLASYSSAKAETLGFEVVTIALSSRAMYKLLGWD